MNEELKAEMNRVETYIRKVNFSPKFKITSKKHNIYVWGDISRCENLSEAFIEKFKDELQWGTLFIYQRLSEKLLRKNLFRLREYNWEAIGSWQNLSEDFIREFKDKLNWGSISYNQELSEEFIEEFKDKFEEKGLMVNPFTPPKTRISLMKKHNILEKENKNHFIEYNKKENNRLKDFEDLLK